MLSHEYDEDHFEITESQPGRGKKRRLERACDFCRRRKSRCDGTQAPGQKCSICWEANAECTYTGSDSRSSAKRSIATLETQLAESEALVRDLRAKLANTHFGFTTSPSYSSSSAAHHHLPTPKYTEATPAPALALPTDPRPGSLDGASASLYIMRAALRSLAAPPPPPYEEDMEHLQLAYELQLVKPNLPLAPPSKPHRWLGKSSGAMLVKAAIDLKADVKREEAEAEAEAEKHLRGGSVDSGRRGGSVEKGNGTGDGGRGREDGTRGFGTGDGFECGADFRSARAEIASWTARRMQYWQWRPWHRSTPRTDSFEFPPDALMHHLVDVYFKQRNVFLPLLHRPTFEREWKSGLHLKDDAFAATLLLVCAVGSRWSDDPSVSEEGLACGWKWFEQTLKIPSLGDHLFGQAKLYDLQYYSLAVMFLEGSSASQACWTLVGVGLRLAQDIGVHRRKAPIQPPSVEGELYKRAFWVLVYLDRQISSMMGRTCAVEYDELDIDPPLEVDDEYWEHPTHPFEQPQGAPSTVVFFNNLLRLNHILSLGLKILYPLAKVRVFFSINGIWEESLVAELDSSLNEWLDRLPEHLRWDPNRENQLFFDQSVALHAAYFHLQILIHRPFIPMLRKSAPTALPSLAICTSAARSCANIVDVQRQRNGKFPVIINLGAVFTSSIILLLNIWSVKRKGMPQDLTREMAHVQKCMDVVKLCEERWQVAGLLWDVLAELASVGQLPLPGVPQNATAQAQRNNSASHLSMDSSINPVYSYRKHESRSPELVPVEPCSSFSKLIGLHGDPVDLDMGPSVFAPAPANMNVTSSAASASAEHASNNSNSNSNAYMDPAQASRELGDMMDLIDTMWANAPVGLDVDVWGTYLESFNEMAQGQGEFGKTGEY
ncbi:Zn(2)-C6 fungal-type domain-containing protein [Favolaschia claudopus]|uniref:Zn(2)-C6 fungal-type domain-containing protein n=1 Tax=Favolaschia claudopus TaxID=2862362 RepID=A0AAW0BK66_9AGAR